MLMMTASQNRERRTPPDECLSAIQRLRYEVYCLERRFRVTTYDQRGGKYPTKWSDLGPRYNQ